MILFTLLTLLLLLFCLPPHSLSSLLAFLLFPLLLSFSFFLSSSPLLHMPVGCGTKRNHLKQQPSSKKSRTTSALRLRFSAVVIIHLARFDLQTIRDTWVIPQPHSLPQLSAFLSPFLPYFCRLSFSLSSSFLLPSSPLTQTVKLLSLSSSFFFSASL